MSDWTLCIDFGTAFSKAAAAPTGAWAKFDPRLVRPLALSQEGTGNRFLLDSAVFVDEGRVLFGRAAIARADALSSKRRLALRSFKTLLSVSDLDRALNTNAPTSIDPNKVFQMRDLIVLYLAFLLESVAQAIAADPMLRGSQLSYRYAAPAWRTGDSAGMHDSVLRLFGEAEAFRALLGERLLSLGGLVIDTITDKLPRATAKAGAYDMGLIFEATAAAAYTSVGLEGSGSHLIVLDMGAGTTDIAALVRTGASVFELPEARYTFKQAGDFVDGVIANVVLDSAKWASSQEQRSTLWSALMRQMRDIKETVFADGQATLRHEGRTISLTMRDIERDQDFREFLGTLQRAYADSLAVVRNDARARKREEVQAVAVGGGAAAPFINAAIAARPRGGGPRVVARPATPDWAHASEFQGNLAPVFPQLAIAIGGALAPDEMLAAGSVLSPA